MKLVLLIAFVVCIAARIVEAGECCRAYTNLFVRESAKFCSKYCCGDSSIKLEWLRAPSDDRTSFCGDWFINTNNIWAIILGLAVVACIVVCCCYHFCCKTRTQGTVIVPPQQGMAGTQMVAISSQTAGYHPPGQGPYPPRAGYNPYGQGHQPPGYYPPGTVQQPAAGSGQNPPTVDASNPYPGFQKS